MTSKKEFQTIAVIVIGLLVLYYVFEKPFFLIGAIPIGFFGVLIPLARRHIVRLWFQLARGLGFINSRIILSVIFFLILVPIALMSRLFSKDKLQLRKKKPGESYYRKRDHKFTADDFKNLW